jgi:hypothetical protein
MRALIIAAMLVPAACNIDNDPGKDQVTVKYDEERIKKSAATAGRTAKDVATGVANVAVGTGKVIKREVGDVDVDVKVSRNRPDPNRPPPSGTQ